MDNSRGLAHEQALEVLPWYVTGRLQEQQAREVESHLGDCLDCRREADGLTQMMTLHQNAMPERPVNEARLQALLGRIERYEEGRLTPSAGTPDASLSPWAKFKQQMQSWLNVRPVLLAGACTAALVAIIGIPSLRTPVATDARYEVQGPAVDTLRVRLQFEGAAERSEVERLVRAQYSGTYRIEAVTEREYVVSLEDKPGIDAVGRLLTSWSEAPNVAHVRIDSGTAGAEQ
jgi:anti-sigma factor RsiW